MIGAYTFKERAEHFILASIVVVGLTTSVIINFMTQTVC